MAFFGKYDILNIAMKKRGLTLIKALLTICAVFAICARAAFCQDHIRELDTVRASMAELGSRMPEVIKNAGPQDIRTLERVFEINNYALVTIESYLKMMKVSVSSNGGISKDVVAVLNGWLQFIAHYCEYDIKYFDEVLAETKDAGVIDIINTERNNINYLKDISGRGMEENSSLFGRP